MNKWFKYFLILSLIGGGFAEFSIILQAIISGKVPYVTMYLLVSAVCLCISATCIYAGLKILEDMDLGLKLARILFLIQIPIINSNYFIYKFLSGFLISIGFNITNMKLNFFAQIGSSFSISFLADNAPLEFGINIIALFAAIKLWKMKSLQPAK